MDVSVGVVAALFLLSLVAAWVLFNVLKSTASITRKEYQVGGAAAGFLLIYGALYYSYTGVANVEAVKSQLTGCQASLAEDEAFVPVRGIVDPRLSNANAFVATNLSQIDVKGNFSLQVRKKDLRAGRATALWIVNDQQKNFLNLDTQDLAQEIVFKIPEARP